MNETGIAGPRNVSVGLILIAVHITLDRLYKQEGNGPKDERAIRAMDGYQKYQFNGR